MIPDFPHIKKNKIGSITFSLLHPDFAESGRDKKNIEANVIFYYEASLVSSNLNSKLFWFHSNRPNQYINLPIQT